MKLLSFVWVEHVGLACGAALLFSVGCLLALPVVRWGANLLTWLPRVLFTMVRRLLGAQPSMTRLWAVIFGFNGTAMFLYMASGFHPAIPAAVSLLTGYNITAILLLAGESNHFDALAISPAAGWAPPRWIAVLCGLAVLMIELPCFWYAIAMGIGLGQEIAAGRTGYLQGMAIRLHAYVVLILPALLVSAVCEAIAIRGMAASAPDSQGERVKGKGSRAG